MSAMSYAEAIEQGAKELNNLYYVFNEPQHLQTLDDVAKGYYLALAMVYGETVQHIESCINDQ